MTSRGWGSTFFICAKIRSLNTRYRKYTWYQVTSKYVILRNTISNELRVQGLPWEAMNVQLFYGCSKVDPGIYSLYSQQIAGRRYPLLEELGPHTPTVFPSGSVFNLHQFYDLNLGLPRGLSPSRFVVSVLYVFLTLLFHAVSHLSQTIRLLTLMFGEQYETRSSSPFSYIH